jgi:predicted NAD/FAD-binding protein
MFLFVKIAIIGSGISGLGAAYLLSRAHDVTVFERDSRAGGHTHTVRHGGLALDTGFLVHNTRNYPLLSRLFEELEVKTQSSEMSFSVSCEGCGLEYSGRRLLAQRRNAVSVRFGSLVWEIGRWLRTARRSLEETDYERHGDVDDVVFPCGYTMDADGDAINIYYGAADCSIALARSSVRTLLNWLDANGSSERRRDQDR